MRLNTKNPFKILMPNSINQALERASKKIPLSEAEILLAFALKKKKTWLYQNPNQLLSLSQYSKFQLLLRKRQSGIPIAYLLSQKEFYGLDFYVDRRVLIPREETETLVEIAFKKIQQLIAENPDFRKRTIRVADVGTGSGCIAVSLAKKFLEGSGEHLVPRIKIYAIDISKKALSVAKRNIEKHNVQPWVNLLYGKGLTPLPEKVNIIVANLPYIPSDYFKLRSRNFKKSKQNQIYPSGLFYEPKIALDGGKEGLEIIKKVLGKAPKYLLEQGVILLEISPEQKKPLKEWLNNLYPNVTVLFYKDLSGLERVIEILKPN